jgi:hypothetical protein
MVATTIRMAAPARTVVQMKRAEASRMGGTDTASYTVAGTVSGLTTSASGTIEGAVCRQ